MASQIYRGYTVLTEQPGQFPVEVHEGDTPIWFGRTEDEALAFIDQTKRELAEAARKT